MNTCYTCRHWYKRPADPSNLGVVTGECRAVPPTIAMVFVQAPGGPAPANVTTYPGVPPDFPACGMHEERTPAISV